MIKTILWDVDGTLLDFHAAERAAMETLFGEFNLGPCTEEMLARYSVINVGFWERLERGELTMAQILLGRFERFFSEYGIDPGIARAFNDRYQLTLGDTIAHRDDSLNVVKALKGRVRQYVVSNGTVAAQTKKLDRSGLGEQMDGIFLSEELGVEKPNIGFFEKVFSVIRPKALSEVMIVGDSLTSDIRGGMNAGIKTCWYDPQKRPVPEGYRVDHRISDLRELPRLLDQLNHYRLTRYLPVLETDETLYDGENGYSDVVFRFLEDLELACENEPDNEGLRTMKQIFDREETDPGHVFRHLDEIIRGLKALEAE